MNNRKAVALVAGLIFGLGLSLSEMVNPAKVLNFLDIAGNWDPTLAFVMGGALLVTVPTFRLILKRPAPLLDSRFHLPEREDIDTRLIVGACLFGLGWGIAGLCPGPAVVALVSGFGAVFGFFGAMLAGNWLASKI